MTSDHFVTLSPCPDYSLAAVRRAVRECLDLPAFTACLRPGATVLLKPNVVNPRGPERTVCTHPALVRALAEIVFEAGCEVLVADQPTFALAAEPDAALEPTGYREALKGVPADLFLLGCAGYEPVAVPSPLQLPTVHVSRAYRSVDAVVNLVKCKTHVQTTLTLALKNTFGAVAPRDRLRVHALGTYSAVAEGLADCFSVAVPQLSVLDAVVAMEGSGPTRGAPRQVGLIAAATNAVALDLVTEYLVGMPGEVGLTQAAASVALGPVSLEDVCVIGANPDELRTPLRRPPRLGRSYPRCLSRLGERLLYIRPRIDAQHCIGCGGCVQACPVGAVRVAGHAQIDRARCVECFCCMEACPADAVSVDRSLLARMFATP